MDTNNPALRRPRAGIRWALRRNLRSGGLRAGTKPCVQDARRISAPPFTSGKGHQRYGDPERTVLFLRPCRRPAALRIPCRRRRPPSPRRVFCQARSWAPIPFDTSRMTAPQAFRSGFPSRTGGSGTGQPPPCSGNRASLRRTIRRRRSLSSSSKPFTFPSARENRSVGDRCDGHSIERAERGRAPAGAGTSVRIRRLRENPMYR